MPGNSSYDVSFKLAALDYLKFVNGDVGGTAHDFQIQRKKLAEWYALKDPMELMWAINRDKRNKKKWANRSFRIGKQKGNGKKNKTPYKNVDRNKERNKQSSSSGNNDMVDVKGVLEEIEKCTNLTKKCIETVKQ